MILLYYLSVELSKVRHFLNCILFAEAVRFELTVPCGTLVFKTSAIDLSATPPL